MGMLEKAQRREVFEPFYSEFGRLIPDGHGETNTCGWVLRQRYLNQARSVLVTAGLMVPAPWTERRPRQYASLLGRFVEVRRVPGASCRPDPVPHGQTRLDTS